MIKEALEFLQLKTIDVPCVVDVHETNTEIHKVVSYGDGDTAEKIFIKDQPSRQHIVYSVKGLIDLLEDENFKDERGYVFVGQEEITVDMAYKKHDHQLIRVPLGHADEYKSLNGFYKGLTQREAWKALHALGDTIATSDDLILALSEINVKAISKGDSKMDKSGITTVSRGEEVRVTINTKDGEKDTVFDRFHVYNGPLWECFDAPIELKLQFYVEEDPKFYFQPKQLGKVIRDHRLMLSEHLRESLDKERFTVVEGDR